MSDHHHVCLNDSKVSYKLTIKHHHGGDIQPPPPSYDIATDPTQSLLHGGRSGGRWVWVENDTPREQQILWGIGIPVFGFLILIACWEFMQSKPFREPY